MINDSVGNKPAILENINSLNKDGVSLNDNIINENVPKQYIDLGSNTLNLGGEFSFETVVKTNDINNTSTVMCLGDIFRVDFGEFTDLNNGNAIASVNFDNYFNNAYSNELEFTSDFDHSNRTEYPLNSGDSGMTFFKSSAEIGTVNIKFKVNGTFRLICGMANWSTAGIYSVKLYKNSNLIESVNIIKKEIIFENIVVDDVIQIKDDVHCVCALYSLEKINDANKLELTMGDSISLSMENNNVVKTINIPSSITNNKFYHIVGNLDIDNSLAETFYYGENTGSLTSSNTIANVFSPYPTNAFSVDYSTVTRIQHAGYGVIIPGKANDDKITGSLPYSNYNKAILIENNTGTLNTYYISFTFNNSYKCRIIYGSGGVYTYNSSTGVHTYKNGFDNYLLPVILKNDELIDKTNLIQKEIEVDIEAGDVIKIQGGGQYSGTEAVHTYSDVWTTILLYAMELYEADKMNLYVDGELAGSTSVTRFDANTTFTYNYLGKNTLNTNYLNGSISYFRVWDNYELTDENIDYLYLFDSITNNSFVLDGNNRSLTDVYSLATLTLGNNPTFDTNGVELAGSHKITIPKSILGFGSDDFTVSLWIMSTEPSGHVGGYDTMFSFSWKEPYCMVFAILPTSRKFYLQNVDANGNVDQTINADFIYPNDNTVHNYIITRSGTSVKCYVDGTEIIEMIKTTPVPDSDYIIGGASNSSNGSLLGLVKKIDIWKGISLSPLDISKYLSIVIFNKVRIFRSDATSSGGYNLEIAEFQIWINGTNVAPNITPTNYIERTDGSFGITYINNGNTGDVYIATGGTQQSAYSGVDLEGNSVPITKNLTDDPIEVIFNIDETKINDLQSIVVYGRNHLGSYYRLEGASLQLMCNDDVIYTQEINDKKGTSNQLVWRFDGPGISNVSTFSTTASTTQIIGDSYSKLFIYTIAIA